MRIWNYYRNKKLFYRGGLLWFLIFFWSAHIFAQSQESSLAEREFTFAQKLYDDGLFTLAAQEFQHFVEKYPTHPKAPEALFLSGSAYFSAKQFLKAFDTYRDLEIRFPNSELLPRVRYQLARCQLNLKHYLDAAALFKRVATLHPEDGLAPLALFEAGKSFYLKGEKDRAISTFLELIHTYPDVPQRLEAHFEIVKIYFEQKSYSHALREINAIMNILNEGIEDPRVYWYRGLVFERLGQWREAESNFQQLVEKFPHDKLSAAAYFKLGNLAYMQGFLEKSLEMFQKSLTNNEDSDLIFKAFIQLGTIQAEKGNFDEALAYLLKADSLAKNSELDFKARHRLAQMLAKLKQYNKAAIQYREIIKKMRQATKPDTSLIAQVYSEYLKVLIDQGSLDEALNLIKQFTISFPDVKAEKLQLEKGRLLEKHLQKHTRALRAYDEFLEKYRTSPYVDEAQFGLARCYEKLSQFKLALNEYKEYLQNYPGGDDYREVQQRKAWIEHTVV
ncbi:MAG: outer membrane protein assembly factor BamD, partial [Calditrichaeota bacterium]